MTKGINPLDGHDHSPSKSKKNMENPKKLTIETVDQSSVQNVLAHLAVQDYQNKFQHNILPLGIIILYGLSSRSSF